MVDALLKAAQRLHPAGVVDILEVIAMTARARTSQRVLRGTAI